jgi:[protein-PII] uridylyltransferase
MPRSESLVEFEASMPAPYLASFDADARKVHAGIASRRMHSATRLEVWKVLPERVVGICIVADDRPGLLLQISAALLASEIDVIAAHAYCRRPPDRASEAVDFLWIRRLPRSNGTVGRIRARDVAVMGEMVDALVRGDAQFDGALHFARALRTASASTRVRFEQGEEEGTMMLIVEATDQPGLLLVVTKAIFQAGLQILGLRATSEHGCALDRFHLAEVDGRPLVRERLLGLQADIFASLEEAEADPTPALAGP